MDLTGLTRLNFEETLSYLPNKLANCLRAFRCALAISYAFHTIPLTSSTIANLSHVTRNISKLRT